MPAAQIDEYNAWMMLLLFLPALVCGLATYAFWAVPRGKTRFEDAGRRFKDKVGVSVVAVQKTIICCLHARRISGR